MSGRSPRRSIAGNISCGTGSRQDPYLRATHATPGTCSRVRRCRRSSPGNVIARSAEAVRRIRARGGDVIFIRPPSAPQLRVGRGQAAAAGQGLGHASCRNAGEGHPRRRPAAGAEPGRPRMVAPQPQVRDGVHRRLCAAPDRAHPASEAARRCPAAAHPRRLRPAGESRTTAMRKAA